MFCSDCSDFRLLTRDPKDPAVVISVRACRPCFDTFRGRKIRGQKANSGMAAASPAISRVRRNSKAEQQPPEQQQHLPQHPPPQHKSQVEMPPQHQFEGEDADITGHETIVDQEDEDHYVYPDAHPQTVTLVMGVPSDVSHQRSSDVARDAVMAAQGSVVLPSKSAVGGLQFVDVDTFNQRFPPTAANSATSQAAATDKEQLALSQSVGGGDKDEFDRSLGAVEGSEEILHVPSDALASVRNARFVLPEAERSVSAVEGSEEILHIPADALASVKHAHSHSQQQQQHQMAREDGQEVAWSDRNVESHIVAPSPTTAVPLLFDLASSTGEQQSQAEYQQQQQQREEQRKLNIVV